MKNQLMIRKDLCVKHKQENSYKKFLDDKGLYIKIELRKNGNFSVISDALYLQETENIADYEEISLSDFYQVLSHVEGCLNNISNFKIK